jgi:T-complex protein 1 subunit zeta
MTSAVSTLTRGASDIVQALQALTYNINAGKGLQGVLESNLGPRGSMKMLVSGAGDIKITKDGAVLLKEMQIQHPTASIIARAATSQDQITGDGTTSVVLFIGELLRHAERYLADGLHPRILTDGFLLANKRVESFIDQFKVKKDVLNHDFLSCVARTSLRTKVNAKLADKLTSIVTDAVLTIHRPNQQLDLFMIEVMAIQQNNECDSRLVQGLVVDHGARHPNMPRALKNAYILTCNVSLEKEKPVQDVVADYKTAEQREEFANEERKFIDDRLARIIALKREVCDTEDKTFMIVNQKGIDPGSLSALANEGILALRRAKRRNMERLTLACGGIAVNSVEDLSKDVLGFAKNVYEHSIGEEKYTFIEGVENPFSVTILIKGPNKFSILQMKDAIRDGIRAVKNTIEDGYILPGAAAFEIAAYLDLQKYMLEVKGRTKYGVQAFADALLVIPKTLAANSGFDTIDTLLQLQEEQRAGHVVGLDIQTGDPCDPDAEGIYDNVVVKKHFINAATMITSQLLLVDEVLRAASKKEVDNADGH